MGVAVGVFVGVLVGVAVGLEVSGGVHFLHVRGQFSEIIATNCPGKFVQGIPESDTVLQVTSAA